MRPSLPGFGAARGGPGPVAENYSIPALTRGCYMGMFVFGIALAILGALLPLLFQTLQLDPAQAGSLFLFLSFGALAVTLAAGPIFDRSGYKAIMTGSSVCAAAALAGMAYTGTYPLMAVCCFLLGLGGGGLNAGTNALVADLWGAQRGSALNRLGIFFGFGALFIPLFTGTLVEVLSLKGILLVTAGVALAPGVFYALSPFPPGKHAARGLPLGEILGLLRNRAVLLMAALLWFQSGNEITSSGWMSTYLVQELALTAATASFYLAGFWGAVMLGRLVASYILRYWSEATLVQVSGLLAAASAALFVSFPHPVFSAFTAPAIGFAMAGIFPSVLGQAAGRFPQLSGSVLAILISCALVGGMLVPWMAGLLAGTVGLKMGLMLPVVGFCMVFVLQSVIKRNG